MPPKAAVPSPKRRGNRQTQREEASFDDDGEVSQRDFSISGESVNKRKNLDDQINLLSQAKKPKTAVSQQLATVEATQATVTKSSKLPPKQATVTVISQSPWNSATNGILLLGINGHTALGTASLAGILQ